MRSFGIVQVLVDFAPLHFRDFSTPLAEQRQQLEQWPPGVWHIAGGKPYGSKFDIAQHAGARLLAANNGLGL
jgi:hypothetical protein